MFAIVVFYVWMRTINRKKSFGDVTWEHCTKVNLNNSKYLRAITKYLRAITGLMHNKVK